MNNRFEKHHDNDNETRPTPRRVEEPVREMDSELVSSLQKRARDLFENTENWSHRERIDLARNLQRRIEAIWEAENISPEDDIYGPMKEAHDLAMEVFFQKE